MSNYYYVNCENKENLCVYLSSVIGPSYGYTLEDLNNKDMISCYFDPTSRFGVSIIECSDDDIENTKREIETARNESNSAEIDKLLSSNHLFILVGFDKDNEVDLDARLREVVSMAHGGVCYNATYANGIWSKEAEYIPHRKITQEEYERQLAMFRRCAKALNIKKLNAIANDEKPNKAVTNLAYGTALYSGFISNRKFIYATYLKDHTLLCKISNEIERKYIQKYPNMYLRAEHIGERMNTLSFIAYAFKNYEIKSLNDLKNQYDLISTTFANYLSSENFDANKQLRFVKESIMELSA